MDILCSNNFLKSHFGESESAAESCVESCGSFTLVKFVSKSRIWFEISLIFVELFFFSSLAMGRGN